LSENKSY